MSSMLQEVIPATASNRRLIAADKNHESKSGENGKSEDGEIKNGESKSGGNRPDLDRSLDNGEEMPMERLLVEMTSSETVTTTSDALVNPVRLVDWNGVVVALE
eukprot:508773-Amphidinium_carterae.1